MLIDVPDSYQDEFGEIDAEVLREARNIWRFSQKLVLKTLGDEAQGQVLMMRAVAEVSKKFTAEQSTIEHLPSYLFQTFRRLVFAESKKNLRHQELEEKYFDSLEEFFQDDSVSEEAKVCRRILIEEIVVRMDIWTKNVYRYLELGYKYKDLVPHYGKTANIIRATYSRKLKECAENIRGK
jgi:hypothetical protein